MCFADGLFCADGCQYRAGQVSVAQINMKERNSKVTEL